MTYGTAERVSGAERGLDVAGPEDEEIRSIGEPSDDDEFDDEDLDDVDEDDDDADGR